MGIVGKNAHKDCNTDEKPWQPRDVVHFPITCGGLSYRLGSVGAPNRTRRVD